MYRRNMINLNLFMADSVTHAQSIVLNMACECMCCQGVLGSLACNGPPTVSASLTASCQHNHAVACCPAHPPCPAPLLLRTAAYPFFPMLSAVCEVRATKHCMCLRA